MLSDRFGGIGGGIGLPSATRGFTSENAVFGGIGGGIGLPSATRGFPSENAVFGGIGGGIGLPSPRSVRSIKTVLLVVLLTEEIAGSTIRRVKVQITRTNAVFFKGVALLALRMRERILGGLVC